MESDATGTRTYGQLVNSGWGTHLHINGHMQAWTPRGTHCCSSPPAQTPGETSGEHLLALNVSSGLSAGCLAGVQRTPQARHLPAIQLNGCPELGIKTLKGQR